MDVSENRGTPKSSILIGFSIINHPFWGTPIFGNTHIAKHMDLMKMKDSMLCLKIIPKKQNIHINSAIRTQFGGDGVFPQ